MRSAEGASDRLARRCPEQHDDHRSGREPRSIFAVLRGGRPGWRAACDPLVSTCSRCSLHSESAAGGYPAALSWRRSSAAPFRLH